ncbi:unnamed protein product [Arabidopsis thaliana]|uniref:(thale cress) hypothetical protein n=1 Tax=Arabidopsis thaliana TaxID=3702 RepID=A0A7G2E2H7_ARATH|nr:unnamed protein product [Arabidopsis thaliana]
MNLTRTPQTESMATTHAVMGVIRSVMPAFRNKNDKIAFVVHASLAVSGFILTSTGRPAFAHDALSSSTTQWWNEFDEEYAFVYKCPVKRYLVKCLAMNDKLLVDAIAEDGKEFGHLQIEVGNYIDESGEEGDYDTQFKNFDKLVTELKSEILCKLNTVSTTTKSSSETK